MMRVLKAIYWINTFCIAVTLILYVSLVWGLAAQFLLGSFQLFTAVLIFFYWRRMNAKNVQLLLLYWVLAIAYILLFLHVNFMTLKSEAAFIILLIIIPLLLSFYFLFVVYQIKRTIKKSKS
jgi:hypothetical protein